MEHASSELWKWITMVFVIAFVINVGVLSYRANQISDYQNQVDSVAEKTGGITPSAQSKLNTIGENDYGGMFTVQPADSSSGTVNGYGDKINYIIKTNIPYVAYQDGAKHTALQTTYHGSATSQVGKD